MNLRRGLFRAWAVCTGLWYGFLAVVFTFITEGSYKPADPDAFTLALLAPIAVFLSGWFTLVLGGWILQGFKKSDGEI